MTAATPAPECAPPDWVPRLWSEYEQEGMAKAYREAAKKHGHYESLFAVATWVLANCAPAHPPQPVDESLAWAVQTVIAQEEQNSLDAEDAAEAGDFATAQRGIGHG